MLKLKRSCDIKLFKQIFRKWLSGLKLKMEMVELVCDVVCQINIQIKIQVKIELQSKQFLFHLYACATANGSPSVFIKRKIL